VPEGPQMAGASVSIVEKNGVISPNFTGLFNYANNLYIKSTKVLTIAMSDSNTTATITGNCTSTPASGPSSPCTYTLVIKDLGAAGQDFYTLSVPELGVTYGTAAIITGDLHIHVN